MDLNSTETCPLALCREITPRSDKLRSQVAVCLSTPCPHSVHTLSTIHTYFMSLRTALHCTALAQGRGEVLVSLCHQPAASRVTVVVLKARNLPKMDITGLSGPVITPPSVLLLP
jgi:hypothetical protein